MNTPVLFLIFNRPGVTREVFEAISKARPTRLYIAADGPRGTKEGEQQLCEETRKVVARVDWDCEVKTLYREKNLGCKDAVSSAIDWFFSCEEEGIILEDDCLPDQSFFHFCETLLEHYRHDTRIGHISGDNFQQGATRGTASYYFSRYSHIWGWASWRRAWQKYDLQMKDYPQLRAQKQLRSSFRREQEEQYWYRIFDSTFAGSENTWDYQWFYTLTKENMLSILPQVNLVKNIGFGSDATHTSSGSGIAAQQIASKLTHPAIILPDTTADEYTFDTVYAPDSLLIKAVKKLKKISGS